MSDLNQLARQVQGMGFYYDTSVDGTGYKVIASKGFKGHNPEKGEVRGSGFPGTLDNLIGNRSSREGFNEVLSYRTVTGVKSSWFGFKSEEVPVKSEEILNNGTSEETLELVYWGKRVETNRSSRRQEHVVQGLIAPASLVMQIYEAAKSEPQNISVIFQGAFPKLESKYHIKPNGKILIASEEMIRDGNLAGCIKENKISE